MLSAKPAGRSSTPPKDRAQALVELAIVTPVLVGLVAGLFQLGIIVMVQLSLVYSTGDFSRWLAVNPDKTDDQVKQYITNDLPSALSGTTVMYAQNGECTIAAPAVGQLCVQLSPACAALDGNNQCGSRVPGTTRQDVTVAYNPDRNVFLPKANMNIPTLSYDYHVLVGAR